jgi:hypothetical protein
LEKAQQKEIIDSLESSRIKNGTSKGGFSFGTKGLPFKWATSSLFSFVEFNPDIPECEQTTILDSAIFSAAKSGAITPRKIISEVCKKENEFLSKALQQYVLVTSLSLKYTKLLMPINLHFPQARIAFRESLPKRFKTGRDGLLKHAMTSLLFDEPTSYVWVTVRVHARSTAEAATKGLAALDLVRGIWNIYFNHQIISRISSGGTPKPFNSILLGPLHTVHLPKGDLADPNRWWYDPDYTGPVELKDLEKNWNHLKKFERWVLKRSRNSSLEELIVDSIQRYTSALDEKKRHNAFLQLWGLLEFLTRTQTESYDATVRRASFLYRDCSLTREILNHLRERRNRSIHRGQSMDDAETLTCQMKRFCEEFILFLLRKSRNFNTPEECRQFLDSPAAPEVLKKRIGILRQALKFKNGK